MTDTELLPVHTAEFTVQAYRQNSRHLHTLKLVHRNLLNPNFHPDENLVNTQSQSIGAMFFLTGDLCEPKLGASSPAASNTLNKGNAASPVKKHIDANK